MAILQPQDPQKKAVTPSHDTMMAAFIHHDFFSLAFRPFFLLAALFSMISLGVWAGLFVGIGIIDYQVMTPVVWHVHEMIFGFAATVAVGFVLTAVQTWTKLPSLSKGWIVALIVLWLLVRAGLYVNSSMSVTVAIGSQLIWWLIVLGAFARLLLKSDNRRNYVLVPIMAMIALLNMAVISNHLFAESAEMTLHFARSAILVFVMLMGLIGGRVIPFFTASGARIAKPDTPSWLTPLVAAVSLAGALLYFLSYFTDLPFTPAMIMILGGVLHLWRLSFWRSVKTIGIPLLWSLHLSYALMGIGMVLLGTSYFLEALSFGDALHMITIGGIGLMIFSMMSRVSLGHTGRALAPSVWVNAIYLLIGLASITRVVFAIVNMPLIAWLVSAACWIIASGIFVALYTPILWRNPPQ